mgnify:FL=1
MKLTEDQLIEIADEASYYGDVEPYLNYSGRGMYGDTCVGFSGDVSEMLLGIAATQVLGIGEARILATKAHTDSMGMGIIVYFPGVSLDGE